ncbi:amino acid ABC transporter permease [Serinicoccus kebangsaanensis]|uniref:amino acid ABC transporter permease n=1 Tax=Serinicoccus kebangsaanensis TaxID=2602069 RepID=UPI00124F4E1D|nr:amino acid ABC transporter permease [Serinicoccus kebangsaanensis]
MSTQQVLFDIPGPRARVRHRVLAVLTLALFVAVAVWLLIQLRAGGQLDANKWMPFLQWRTWTTYLIPGIGGTLLAALIAILIASPLALGLAMLRMSDVAPVRWVASVFVEFFRAVPVLIMMIFTYFWLSQQEWSVDRWNPLIGVVTGLVLYNASVLCEVIRNGVASLPSGQREAGLSIGLSTVQVRRSILIPQALTAMMPSLVSQLVVIVKDTALGSIILYYDLLTRSQQLSSAFSNVVPAYIVAAVIYILINYSISKVAETLESRQRRKRRATGGQTTDGAGPTGVAGPAVDPLVEHNTKL